MKLLEVHTPEIDASVKYKVLDLEDTEDFFDENNLLPQHQYKTLVLELCVYNLKTEVSYILAKMKRQDALEALTVIYNGCIMLNPGLDINHWLTISNSKAKMIEEEDDDLDLEQEIKFSPMINEEMALVPIADSKKKTQKPRKFMTRTQFFGLEPYLKERVVGQDHVVDQVVRSLKRSVVNISDQNRPIGVFLFAGGSGTGKTQLAKELHKYVFGDHDMVRIDCGEYQHKHENQKLLGSPPGYINSDEGGHFTNQIAKHPNSVVLLDEVEKADPDIWNTFLRVFDEGLLTDGKGDLHSFRNSIIIMTSNLGNNDAMKSMMGSGTGFVTKLEFNPDAIDLTPSNDAMRSKALKAIHKSFKPEFLNRIDNVMVFNYLSEEDLKKVAKLELSKVSDKLRDMGYHLDYPDSVLDQVVSQGASPLRGARGMTKICREQIEDAISDALIIPDKNPPRGTVVALFWDKGFKVKLRSPRKKEKVTLDHGV